MLKRLFVFSLWLFNLQACGSGENVSNATFETRLSLDDLEHSIAAIDTFPKPNQNNLPINTRPQIKFSDSIDPEGIDNFRVRLVDQNGAQIPGVVRMSEENTLLTFIPQSGSTGLQRGNKYTLVQEFVRDRRGTIITRNEFDFYTQKSVDVDGRFEIVDIYPQGRFVGSSKLITVEFTDAVALPQIQDVSDPRCSRTNWVDMFQVINVPILNNGGQLEGNTVSGVACIDRNNPRFLHFNPDEELGINEDGEAFADGSLVRIQIRPPARNDSDTNTNSSIMSVNGQPLLEGRTEHKVVVPSLEMIMRFFFGDR